MKTEAMIFALILCLLGLMTPMASQAANAPSGLLCDLLEHPEETVISDKSPSFGWIYHPSFRNDSQTGYRIIIASSRVLADAGKGNVWDSGWISDSASINVPCTRASLPAGADYFWRVQTRDGVGQAGPFSAAQRFFIGAETNEFSNRYPLKFVAARPVLLTNTAPGRWFVDFGQDAFGYATVQPNGTFSPGTVQARFGEMASGHTVCAPPPTSMVSFVETSFPLRAGNACCSIRPPARAYPRGAVNPPEKYGVVMPFRYLELANFPGTLTKSNLAQMRLLSEFNTNAARFSSSSPALNNIWALCRDTMQMLTFDGVYVDGERERKPYESDAYIHQLSSYAADREFTLPRHSLEYLLQHPTWPTEWKFHNIFMAWADYLQTGDTNLVHRYYQELQADTFATTTPEGSLMRGFPNFPQTKNCDVVDWPPDDRDGFVTGKGQQLNWTNSVNNAFYYRSLQLMAGMATALGNSNDAASYAARAGRVYDSYNAALWSDAQQCYMDGVGIEHASAHGNFFALAFGLVPPGRQPAVIEFLHSRITANGGMPCSVYGAQYFLESLFAAGDANTALDLMTTNGPRGWLNMINLGSTLTTEAWNFNDKPNMDWNHAWGAAPGNLISRFVLGLRPLTPGFGKILIQPHLGDRLTYAQGVVPTIRGPVGISASNAPGSFQLLVDVPGNVTATVLLPARGVTKPVALVDGEWRSGVLSNSWLAVKDIGAGSHELWLSTNNTGLAVALYANRAGNMLRTNAATPAIVIPAAEPAAEGKSE